MLEKIGMGSGFCGSRSGGRSGGVVGVGLENGVYLVRIRLFGYDREGMRKEWEFGGKMRKVVFMVVIFLL